MTPVPAEKLIAVIASSRVAVIRIPRTPLAHKIANLEARFHLQTDDTVHVYLGRICRALLGHTNNPRFFVSGSEGRPEAVHLLHASVALWSFSTKTVKPSGVLDKVLRCSLSQSFIPRIGSVTSWRGQGGHT